MFTCFNFPYISKILNNSILDFRINSYINTFIIQRIRIQYLKRKDLESIDILDCIQNKMSQNQNNNESVSKPGQYLQVPLNLNNGSMRKQNIQPKLNNRQSPSRLQQSMLLLNSANSKQASQTLDIFKSIKEMVSQLSAQKTVSKERIAEQTSDRNIQQTKQLMSLSNEVSYLKQVISSQEQRVRQSEQNMEKTVKQNQNRHRKQIKKYIDLVSERQNQIQNLKKSIKSLTTRNIALTSQIESLSQVKQTLQNTIQKSLQAFRSNIKQFNYSLQQNQLDKVVLEGKYKQICDRTQQVVNQAQETQNMKNKIERKYEKLKQSYELCKNQCVELRFEIQRQKIRGKDLTDFTVKNNSQKNNQSNFERTSKETIQTIKQKTNLIIQKFSCFQQIKSYNKNLEEANAKIIQLSKQNENLKLDLYQKQLQYDELRLKTDGKSYQDQIIANRNPSIFQILCQKKQQIQKFQQKILFLEQIALSVQQQLKKKVQEDNTERKTQERGTNCSQRQEDTKKISKSKFDEIMRQLEYQKQKALARQRDQQQKLRQNDKLRIRQLEQLNSSLRKQIEKLKSINQNLDKDKKNLKNMLQEMIEQAQPKKKNVKKTKNKSRCPVCLNQIGNNAKVVKCTQCSIKTHPDCLKSHECKQFSDTQSFQDN